MAEKLIIKINGDIKNYQESLKEIESQTSNLQDGLSSIAKKSAIAFAALTAAVVGSVAAYRIQEQAEIRTRQTIKATGGAAGVSAEEIFKMASALQEVTTFGDEAIIAGQNMLLTFKNIGEDVFPRTTEIMLDMAEAMGTDLKSTAIQLGKALNDPKVGLTALQRAGITFNEQQKEQIKLMQETGDIAGAQAIILKELESQFGGVAKASAEGTGELIQLKNIIGDLVEDFGKKFLPVLLEIARPLKEFFLQFRGNEELIESIVQITKWGIVVTGLIAGITTVTTLAIGLSASIGALTIAFGSAAIASSAFWATITGPLGIITLGLTAATAGLLTFFDIMSESKDVTGFEEIDKQISDLNQKIKDSEKVIAERSSFLKQAAIKDKAIYEEDLENLKQVREAMLELDQLDIVNANNKKNEKKNLLKQQKEDELALNMELFEERAEILTEGEQLLTELELEKLQERIDLKAEQDIIKKGEELERQGKHNEALKLLEDARTKKLIADSTKENARLKRQSDKRQRDEKSAADLRIRLDAQVNQALSDGGFALARELVNASGMSAKKQFLIQKALGLTQIAINTKMAMMLAVATTPAPAGEAIAATRMTMGLISAGVVAGTAAIQFQGMAHGGLLRGGIPGIDSIPVLAQQNEIISPAQNFEELIGSVRAKREAEKLGSGNAFNQNSELSLVVSYDSEEASQIVTVRQTEDSALGISQQTFNEAV